MNLSYKWLQDYVKISVPAKEYAERMTMTGSKVEGYEQQGEDIENVLVGRILSLERHPDADKLLICSVDVDKEAPVQILTGATNLKVGDLVPAALSVSRLPGGVTIKTNKMRGIESYGMLCSIAELNLTINDCPYAVENGILVLPEEYGKSGDDIRQVLGLDDLVVEFEITPNRPDCLSMIGLARETAASFELPLTLPEPGVKSTDGNIADYLTVKIEAPDLCPRYSAAMAKDIVIKPSPTWLRDRLRSAGIRPINNIVDITNYVMLEYGQPMHAFDYSCIEQNSIIVRKSRDGEKTTTLDGQERTLAPNTLLITDPVKAIGIAGVMGGANSEITENTKMIVFESATFDGPTVRVASRKIGMRTEASGRFEKGLDCENTMPALLRACQLVEELGAGTIIGGVVDAYPSKKETRHIKLDPARINALIGTNVPESRMADILTSFGFTVKGDDVAVPSWRDDAEGIADLAEEVARIYGYDKIPSTTFDGPITKGGMTDVQIFERRAANACFATGFYEIKTLTFSGVKDFDMLALPAGDIRRKALPVANPLGEDQSLMRTTTLHAMLEALARNYNQRTPSARLFELATVYLPHMKDGQPDVEMLPEEKKILTLSMYGSGDFFALKGAVCAILDDLSVTGYSIRPCTSNPSYHPGRCGEIINAKGASMGYLGQLHPAVAANHDIETEVYCAEIDFNSMLAMRKGALTYKALPKYPAVTRDLALTCDEGIYVAQLEEVITSAGGSLLEAVELFDVYRGAQVPQGKKSVAFALSFRSLDHTLADTEIEEAMARILRKLESSLGASRR